MLDLENVFLKSTEMLQSLSPGVVLRGNAAGFQLYPQTVPLRRWFNSSYASFSSLSIMPMGLTPPHSCCKMYGPKEMFLLHAGGSANTDSPDVPENRGLTT